MGQVSYLLANFGGPRNLGEIASFLQELLTDRDVIRTGAPAWIDSLFFRRVARKRVPLVTGYYEKIGGKSPIYDDTEALAEALRPQLNGPVFTFHRYLSATHSAFLETICSIDCSELRVFPLFPQFTYATTGSIARWFARQLPRDLVSRIGWVKSYATAPAFLAPFKQIVRNFLTQNGLREEETVLLCSPHGLPKQYVDEGDPYQKECEASFRALMSAFPQAQGLLAYQSQFGRTEWIRPYTSDLCRNLLPYLSRRKHVVLIPLSFTSDHVETLFEIEYEYLPLIRKQGLSAYRCPALGLSPEWISGIISLLHESRLTPNKALVRN